MLGGGWLGACLGGRAEGYEAFRRRNWDGEYGHRFYSSVVLRKVATNLTILLFVTLLCCVLIRAAFSNARMHEPFSIISASPRRCNLLCYSQADGVGGLLYRCSVESGPQWIHLRFSSTSVLRSTICLYGSNLGRTYRWWSDRARSESPR